MKLYATVTGWSLSAEKWREVRNVMAKHEGKDICLSIERKRKPRSENQSNSGKVAVKPAAQFGVSRSRPRVPPSGVPFAVAPVPRSEYAVWKLMRGTSGTLALSCTLIRMTIQSPAS